MTSTISNKPIRVSNHGGEWSYIRIPFSQLDHVKALLDANGVVYEVDEYTYAVDGRPPVIFLTLARGADPAAIQGLLDNAA